MKLPPSLAHILQKFRPSHGNEVNPYRDWSILLLILLLALMMSVAWNAWFFLAVLQDEATNESVVPTPEPYDLSAARTIFDARALEAERYRSEYQFVDPSK